MDSRNLVMLDVMSIEEINHLCADDLHETRGDMEAFDDVTSEPFIPSY